MNPAWPSTCCPTCFGRIDRMQLRINRLRCAQPLAISMVGWVEIALGVNYSDLADRFDRGGIPVKAGIIATVL